MASPAPTHRHPPTPEHSSGRSAVEKRIVSDISRLPEPALKDVEKYIRQKKRALGKYGGRAINKSVAPTEVPLTRPVAAMGRLVERIDIPHRNLKGSGMGDVLSAAEANARLEAATVDDNSTSWADTELLGVGETADRLGVTRGSVRNWRIARKVVAFQKGVRNYVYPFSQFNEHAPIRGIEQVLQHFSIPEVAWEWLITPNRATYGEPPIEMLRADKVDEVARAAEGALDFA